MAKIKVFICTYKNEQLLFKNIDSLLASDLLQYEYGIFVLNNFGRMSLPEKYSEYNVEVINNEARPDFSRGHLARSWNQAIIHGFRSLKDPDCDIVIAAQNDIIFAPGWCGKIINLHEKFSFIQLGAGDDFQSFTPDAVEKVGLFDERYCNIGGQTHDYHFRQAIYNKEGSTIKDFYHICFHNSLYDSAKRLKDGFDPGVWCGDDKECVHPTEMHTGYMGEDDIIIHQGTGYSREDVSHLKSIEYHTVSTSILRKKWVVEYEEFINRNIRGLEMSGHSLGFCFNFFPFQSYDTSDFDESFWGSVTCEMPQPILYPYFEMDIPNKQEIGYADCTTHHNLPLEEVRDLGTKRTLGKKEVPADVIKELDKLFGGGNIVQYNPLIELSNKESEHLHSGLKLSNCHLFESYENEACFSFFEKCLDEGWPNTHDYAEEIVSRIRRDEKKNCLIVSANPSHFLRHFGKSLGFENVHVLVPKQLNDQSKKMALESLNAAADDIVRAQPQGAGLKVSAYEFDGVNSPYAEGVSCAFDVAFIGPEIIQSIHGRNLRTTFFNNVNKLLKPFSFLFAAVGLGDHNVLASQPYESTLLKNTRAVSTTNDHSSIAEDLVYVNTSLLFARSNVSQSRDDFNMWFHFAGIKLNNSIGAKQAQDLLEKVRASKTAHKSMEEKSKGGG